MARRFWGAALGACLAVLPAACDPGMRVEPVPFQDAPAMDPGVVLAPLQFDQIRFNLRRGQKLASYRDGLDCAVSVGESDGLWWDRGRLMSADIEWSDLFFEEMSASGYTVLGDPQALFPEADRRRAVYRVRAAVEEVRMNLCNVVDVLSRTPLGVQYGKASMRVYWQVYSPILRRVMVEGRSAGYYALTEPLPEAPRTLMAEAFAQAVANFAAHPDLAALVHRPRPTRADVLRHRAGSERWLPYVAPHDVPFTERAEAIRHSVVTLENGEGHGSGFFVAPNLVLTNHHVVEGTQVVRLRLVTGRQVIGDVVAFDEQRDVALLQVEPAGYQPLPISGGPLRVGQDVYAIGSPKLHRLRGTVTKGVVSRFTQNRYGLPDIQADVDIHGGNSGGPLLDMQGNVVGISYAGYGDEKGTGMGLNLFIPIEGALQALNLHVRHPNDTRMADGEGVE